MATLRDIAQGRSIPLVTRAMVATTVALSLVAIVAQLYQKPVPIGSGREPHSMSSPALGSIPDSGERRDPRLSPTETVVSYLVLYPGLLLTRPWTLLLAHWVETNIVLLIGHAAILAGAGMYLEPRWHWLEFLKFVGGVAVAASGATFLCLLAAYAGSRRITYLYDTSIHGLFGVVAGLTVAFKQAIPEHRVVLGNRSWLAFRVNYLTSLYVPFTVAILCLLGLYSYACLVVFGTIAAWVYLRFVKMYNGTRGDLSDAFAFATFFPDPVQ
ncbi:hypothetical protein H4R34_001281 [Dimargaris verticillata]|uniref:Uncharacterized protein n=1 Tax=Dimargaris verticillata TaxID=2761393 RepID=A0A9W8B518_9FUNG|nr:hypothetical protein H4R34_001281 [Dimargaris verticillata]